MKITYWVLMVVGLALIVVGFYWYSVRPSQIKKECSEIAREQTVKATLGTCDANRDNYEACLAKFMPDSYNMCLHEKGL